MVMTEDVTPLLTDDARQILDSHARVGQHKPVSYLPLRTVELEMGITIQAYISIIERLGNKSRAFDAENCCINSGAIYAYSDTDLLRILQNSQDILVANGWPTNPVDFISVCPETY